MRYCRFAARWILAALVSIGIAPQGGASAERPAWRLSGTMLDGFHSKVLLRDGQGAEHALRVGGRIGGCTLLKVTRRTAVFRCGRGGRILSLYAEGGAPGGPRPGERALEQDPYRALSRAWLHALAADKQRLVRAISLRPVVRQGAMHGYRLDHISESAGLGGLGLQRDDIVTSVNGAPASQPEAFMETVNALSQARVISIGIERGERTLTLHYLLR